MNAGHWTKAAWAQALCTLLLLAGCGGGGGDPDRSLPRLNDPPALSAIGDRTVLPGQPLAITVFATDREGDPITLRTEGLPPGAAFDPQTGTFSWAPEESAAGIHYLAFIASDPRGESFETIAITVLPDPLPPRTVSGGITVFGQSLPGQDQDGDIFPGQGNIWDLDADLALLGGGDGQFDWAMALSVTAGAEEEPFPALGYGDLAWNDPILTQAQGVKTVAVAGGNFLLPPLTGSFSALLNGTSDSRLQQRVDLSSLAAGTPLTLTWKDEDILAGTSFADEPLSYELVIRDGEGGVLSREDISNVRTPVTRNISAFAGRTIEISFEARHTNYGAIQIDDVSVRDASGREYIVNGGFETGDLRGWKTALILESQHVSTNPQPLGGLQVTRSFFTRPLSKWGRWVDVFENTGGAAVTATIRYSTRLGAQVSDPQGNPQGLARIYRTPGVTGALSAWDARELLKRNGFVSPQEAGSRDVGLVFGDLTPEFSSLTSQAALDGSPDVELTKTITIAPGQRVALVTFVVLDTVDTGEKAPNLTAVASGVDGVNRSIVQGFRSDPAYREGIPDAVMGIVANWP